MFQLVRYFSIASILAFVGAAVALGVFYRQTAIGDMVAVRETGNVEVTQLFVNAVWDEYADFFLNEAPTLADQELLDSPTTAAFRETVLDQMAGLQVVKVKVFGLDGRTLFSTEAAQIGQDRADNAGFISARSGVPISELTYRGEFSAFEGVIEDRNVISSYVPLIADPASGEIVGVFEVYEDVTPLLARINRTQVFLMSGVVGLLAVLYVALLLIVRRAEGIMRRQQDERDEAVALLRASEERLRDLVENAPILLWTFTPDHKVHTVEGRQIERRDLNPATYLGRPASAIDETVQAAVTKAANGQDAHARFTLHDATFDTHFAPLYDAENKLLNVIGVSHDVTDLLEVEGALSDAKQDLQSRNRQLERAMEFTRMTLASMRDAVKRGAAKEELSVYLKEADSQFRTLN